MELQQAQAEVAWDVGLQGALAVPQFETGMDLEWGDLMCVFTGALGLKQARAHVCWCPGTKTVLLSGTKTDSGC